MPNRPVVNAGVPYCCGMLIDQQDNQSLKITKGYIRDHTNTTDLYLEQDTILNPVDNAQGVNSIDIGVTVAGTTYYVYVIGDSTKHKPTATLLSLSATQPLLPFEYDSYNRIGVTVGDLGNLFLGFVSTGNGLARTLWYDDPLQVVSGGSSTFFVPFDYSAVVPYFAPLVYLRLVLTSSLEINSIAIRHSGSVSSGSAIFAQPISAAEQYYETYVSNYKAPGSADYHIGSAMGDDVDIYIKGFEYSVGI